MQNIICAVRIAVMKSLQQMVVELMDRGWSQTEIALDVKASPSFISRIYRGETKRPDWQKQKRLVQLHERVLGSE